MPASYSTSAYTPDRLIAGSLPPLSRKITLLSGENRTRGALLGRVAGAVSTAAFAGNTGNGTFAATPTVGAGVMEGAYKLIIIEPGTNAGVFALFGPDGALVGRGTVAVAFAGALNFTLQDGATDFVAGDGFTITVAVGTKYKLAAAAAADGSATPIAILAEPVDATSADADGPAYFRGDFDELAVTYGAGITAAGVREQLAKLGLWLVSAQAAE